MNFLSEQQELSRRAHYEDELRKNNGTMNSPDPSKGNLDSLFLGSTATTFLQQFRTEAEVHLEEDQADARLGQQDQSIDPPGAREVFDATRQTCYPSTFRYVEENVGKEVRSNTWLSKMCHDWQSSPSQSLGHMQRECRTGEE